MSFTRKQHYYSSSLIRYFADSKDKVYVYYAAAKSSTFQYTHYKNICYHKNTYETDITDNILERKIAVYEDRIIPIISRINKSTPNSLYTVSVSEIEKLWKFMWLQYHRTDAGRIKLISHLTGRVPSSRVEPVTAEEIYKYGDELKRFNEFFKYGTHLEALLDMTPMPSTMSFHICIGEHFITSDNPVISIMNNKYTRSIDESQFLMPISPNLCIEFQGKLSNCSDNQFVLMKNEKMHWVNEAIINTANYYVISNQPFNVALSSYIDFRFNDSGWLEKKEFC